jgi:hypothetical protein
VHGDGGTITCHRIDKLNYRLRHVSSIQLWTAKNSTEREVCKGFHPTASS